MKIGFSFGRCVRDIVRGDVELADVMCVISRTAIDTKAQIAGVIDHYLWEPAYLLGLDRDRCIEVAETLYETGRLHQPRLYGRNPIQLSNREIWMDLAPTANESNEVVQKAWKAYQMAQRLVVEEAPTHRFATKALDAIGRKPTKLDDNF